MKPSNKNKTVVGIITILLINCFCSFSQTLAEAKKLTLNEQYDLSSKIFRELVSKNPKSADYWFYFGKNLIEAEKFDSAQTLFNEGIRVAPENSLNYIGLAILKKISGDQNQAKVFLEKAQNLVNNKSSEPFLRIAEAHLKYDKKDIASTFKSLEEAEKIDRLNPEIQILFGDAYLELNDGSQAIKKYERAQELDPKSPLAMLRLGQLWKRSRNYSGKDGNKGALEYFQDAIRIAPEFAPAYAELGDLFSLAQRYEEAKENYARFLSLSSNNLYAKKRYVSFLYMTKDYKGTLVEINRIWEKDTSITLLYRLAAYSSFETKDFKKGLEYMQKFFNKQPESKILQSDFEYYGKLLSADGQDDLALEKLSIAMEKDSSRSDLYGEFATIYLKQKKYDLAIGMYKKKISKGKPIAGDYFKLGQAYYYSKQYPNADSAFSRVTEIQPKWLIGFLWQARTKSFIDTDSKLGLAKPIYEKVLELAEQDQTKYQKEMIEAGEYLGAYFYDLGDFVNSRFFFEKVKSVDPENIKAKAALQDIKKKGK